MNESTHLRIRWQSPTNSIHERHAEAIACGNRRWGEGGERWRELVGLTRQQQRDLGPLAAPHDAAHDVSL